MTSKKYRSKFIPEGDPDAKVALARQGWTLCALISCVLRRHILKLLALPKDGVQMNKFIRPSFILTLLAVVAALHPVPALAQSSSYCSGYASDYARRMSAGGVIGGTAVGAGTGAVIGGISNGRRGARRGAGVGAVVGAVGGGVRRANSYDYYYREAYSRCMKKG